MKKSRWGGKTHHKPLWYNGVPPYVGTRQAQAQLDKYQVKGVSEVQIASAQAQVVAGEARVEHWREVRETYRGHLEAISLQVHP